MECEMCGQEVANSEEPPRGRRAIGQRLSVGGTFRRIQCTPDLLPSDITASSVLSG